MRSFVLLPRLLLPARAQAQMCRAALHVRPVDWCHTGSAGREKVRNGAYNNIEEWKTDVQRIWDNCRKFNGEDHFVTKQAEKLQQHFERRMGEAQAAAARDLAALQQRGGDGAANNAGKVPSKPKNRSAVPRGWGP
jgi:hypothetical protein